MLRHQRAEQGVERRSLQRKFAVEIGLRQHRAGRRAAWRFAACPWRNRAPRPARPPSRSSAGSRPCRTRRRARARPARGRRCATACRRSSATRRIGRTVIARRPKVVAFRTPGLSTFVVMRSFIMGARLVRTVASTSQSSHASRTRIPTHALTSRFARAYHPAQARGMGLRGPTRADRSDESVDSHHDRCLLRRIPGAATCGFVRLVREPWISATPIRPLRLPPLRASLRRGFCLPVEPRHERAAIRRTGERQS